MANMVMISERGLSLRLQLRQGCGSKGGEIPGQQDLGGLWGRMEGRLLIAVGGVYVSSIWIVITRQHGRSAGRREDAIPKTGGHVV